MSILLYKEVGETPLECLERGRRPNGIAENIPMTYAGRLDPMAEGLLLVLVGEECKQKDKFLGLDKEYELEVLFGVTTDTGDVLGIIQEVNTGVKVVSDFIEKIPMHFIGKFEQEYPAYSSKTVGGQQLHSLARAGELPHEMPTKNVEVYSIELIKNLRQDTPESELAKLSGQNIAAEAIKNISKVTGDFRQDDIIAGWRQFSKKYGNALFPSIKLRVKCSSGTYMRSFAERIGREVGAVAIASSIVRTKIGNL